MRDSALPLPQTRLPSSHPRYRGLSRLLKVTVSLRGRPAPGYGYRPVRCNKTESQPRPVWSSTTATYSRHWAARRPTAGDLVDGARLAVAAFCVVGVLAGCGTQRPGVTQPASTIPADQLIGRAASATAAAGTARLLLTSRLDVNSPGANATQTTSSNGVVDFRADRSDLLEHQPYGGGSETRRIGTASYEHQQQPPGLSHLGPDKPWLRTDLSAQERHVLGTSPLLIAATPADLPAALSRLPADADGKVTSVGTEQIDGTSTRHLRLTVAPARAAARADSQAEQLNPRAAGCHRAPGPQPVDVWIDDQQRLRRIELHSQFPLGAWFVYGGGTPTSDTLTRTLSDFGLPVHVPTPPADQIETESQFLAQLQHASHPGTVNAPVRVRAHHVDVCADPRTAG